MSQTGQKRKSLSARVTIALSKSPVSLALGDEVPHIFTRKPRLRPLEFLIIGAKRLLQHNPPRGDIPVSALGMSAKFYQRTCD